MALLADSRASSVFPFCRLAELCLSRSSRSSMSSNWEAMSMGIAMKIENMLDFRWQRGRLPSCFPNSIWEPYCAKLRFATIGVLRKQSFLDGGSQTEFG